MTFQNLNRTPTTARQTLVEATGSPFAPGPATRDVVAVLDGRQTNDDLEPDAWTAAIAATDGDVAIHFELPADREMWVAFDGEVWHRWTTYPTGAWDHHECERYVIETNLEMNEGHTYDIYRSRVVLVDDAPGFVRRRVSDRE